MSNLEIANTIREQIQHGQGVTGQNGALCLMAWGAQTFVGGDECINNRGFLQFKVSGMKFKGLVKIKLEWDDTYTVEFWKGRGTKLRIVDSLSSVYFFELTPTIDLYVEGE